MTVNPATRQAFIAGLRSLADFLAAHPDVPVQRYGRRITLHTGSDLPCDGTWDSARAAVDSFAEATGGEVTRSPGGHYLASRSFGSITYEAVAIPETAMAEYDALMSYRGSVIPGVGGAEPARIAEVA